MVARKNKMDIGGGRNCDAYSTTGTVGATRDTISIEGRERMKVTRYRRPVLLEELKGIEYRTKEVNGRKWLTFDLPEKLRRVEKGVLVTKITIPEEKYVEVVG